MCPVKVPSTVKEGEGKRRGGRRGGGEKEEEEGKENNNHWEENTARLLDAGHYAGY